jgi:hypothetical protein
MSAALVSVDPWAAMIIASRGYCAFSQVANDLAAIAIPIAFLASDRVRCGLPRGEQTILLALFGAVLTVLVIFADRLVGTTFGSVPLGPVVMMTRLSVALRRAFCRGEQ